MRYINPRYLLAHLPPIAVLWSYVHFYKSQFRLKQRQNEWHFIRAQLTHSDIQLKQTDVSVRGARVVTTR